MTGRVPLQAIHLALNDFRVGFTFMAGAQATAKGYRVRVGLSTSFMAYNITHSKEDYTLTDQK